MGYGWCIAVLCLAATPVPPVRAQVIEFESNGLKYQALSRDGLTIMLAHLPVNVRDYAVVQVAVANGGSVPVTIRPEDFLFLSDNGAELPALPPRTVVNSLVQRGNRGDVIRLITTYESGIYGNTQYKGTNGYEARRQSALAEFTSTRLRAAAAASAIAFVQTKLAPGQSTDGAIFYPFSGSRGTAPVTGTIRVRAAGSMFEFPLISLSQSP